MKAKDIMSAKPECVTLTDTIEAAAQIMANSDCGVVPVVNTDSKNVVGILTDRDIAIRAVARGKPSSTLVRDIMTSSVATCSSESDVADVERTMSDRQVRRVVIVDGDECVGIISQGDIARAAGHQRGLAHVEVAHVVERISEAR